MTLAHKLAHSNKFFGVAKYADLLSVAMKQAWLQVRKGVEEVSAEAVAAFIKTLPACSAWITSDTKVELTFRGKKTDKVFINLDARKVSRIGNTAILASQIANQFNFSLS